jgi:copper chaperone CopZ
MQQLSLVIPHLDTASQALDLSNTLMSISGISHVVVDRPTRTVTVDYEREYLSEGTLKEFVKGAGYPSEGDQNSP